MPHKIFYPLKRNSSFSHRNLHRKDLITSYVNEYVPSATCFPNRCYRLFKYKHVTEFGNKLKLLKSNLQKNNLIDFEFWKEFYKEINQTFVPKLDILIRDFLTKVNLFNIINIGLLWRT